MNRMLTYIKKMHNKFGIPSERVYFTDEEKKFRIECLKEEVQEYEEAINPEDELDALVDLVVFAFGTAERQGMLDIFEDAFNRVMSANLSKEVGPNQKRGGFALDLVKPIGWQAADLTDLIEFTKDDKQETLKLFPGDFTNGSN